MHFTGKKINTHIDHCFLLNYNCKLFRIINYLQKKKKKKKKKNRKKIKTHTHKKRKTKQKMLKFLTIP